MIVKLGPFHTICAIVVAAVLLGGCRSDGNRPVADSTMIAVLVDLYLVDAAEQVERRTPAGLRDSIFHQHGIDRSTYERALSYYADHPQAYADLYGRVVDRLSLEQSGITTGDSLRFGSLSTLPAP